MVDRAHRSRSASLRSSGYFASPGDFWRQQWLTSVGRDLGSEVPVTFEPLLGRVLLEIRGIRRTVEGSYGLQVSVTDQMLAGHDQRAEKRLIGLRRTERGFTDPILNEAASEDPRRLLNFAGKVTVGDPCSV